MEWQFRADDARFALSLRHAFVEQLRAQCTPQSDCENAGIILSELVANVVRHAPGPIEISARSDTHGLVTLDVCDTGDGFTPVPSLPATPYSESGRGLYIVAQLCARLATSRLTNGHKVSVVLPVVAQRGQNHLVNA
jgi:anti-sigma regulatory factor (Ser/Thr protein kinase)